MELITAVERQADDITPPTIESILATQKKIQPWVLTTPTWQIQTHRTKDLIGEQGELFYKIECWQHTGTFKARGAVASVMQLNDEQLAKGITAISAGNHAIAVSYAAHCFNTNAKVLMPKTANAVRVQQCRDLGAEVIFTNDMHELFDRVAVIQKNEGRTLIHPYEGVGVALGTGSLGAELCQQLPNLDAVVVAVGGGGLIAGMANAIKQIQPNCKVYGVEPHGCNTMSESFQQGVAVKAETLTSIADSLSAPHAEPYSYSLCAQSVDGIVNVDDDQIREAMQWLFQHLLFAVEPAGAAATAGLLGPLKPLLHNKRVAIILCGSNIDPESYNKILQKTVSKK
ncbi:MAG: pyridoxal-phosphate dependent enzyme [Coxiellaceae bacterium]|nr:pyridoxal-phosphate dependent enzyme [Coxiellaceae bacterium]